MNGLKHTPSAYRLVHFVDTGNFLVMEGGNKALRYDENNLYFWDQRMRREVSIPRVLFNTLLEDAPRYTSYGRQ